ncbi:MAG: hypothetical protein B6U97_00070 [Candidatus Altiarchaeales archaeon ex4484_96]|nr:MAG: hypothetical protein B6U97_00070 [Candidatus Altiarchaeales archaeon ex4484_96]
MKAKALLETKSVDAASIALSLQTDNVRMDKLCIETKASQDYIITRVQAQDLGCLLNTLDDIVRAQMIAEKVIS